MPNFEEKHRIHGHLEITKEFKDGKKEVVFDDHNIIVSGMGAGLNMLFSLAGSQSIVDFQLDRFQVGLSGTSSLEVSTTYELSSPLSSTAEYGGTAARLVVVSSTQLANGADVTNQVFALIPFSHVTRVDETTVRYTIVLDENAANGNTLNEIGLFMKNPQGRASDASILVAYRSFSDITKSTDFALVFRWSITF